MYEGYVKNVNLLNERLSEIRSAGKAAGSDPGFAELVRRLGFEYNGMRLHEYYFDNMTAEPREIGNGRLYDALGEATADSRSGRKTSWPSAACAASAGRSRIATSTNGQITNHWISDHENGNLAGFVPVVVMDVWEHAFIKDYKPAEKSKYIEAFFANLDWKRASRACP